MGCCVPEFVAKPNKSNSRCEDHRPIEVPQEEWFDGECYRNHFTHPPLGEGVLGFFSWLKTRFNNRNITKAVPACVTDLNLGLINNPQEPQITWLGHASVLIQMEKLNILVDPCLVWNPNRYYKKWFYAKRLVPSPIKINKLPRIDAILITHNHGDHLDMPALRSIVKDQESRLGNIPKFFVPCGLDIWFRKRNIPNPVAVKWWGKDNSINGLIIAAAPAQHWSTRTIVDMNRSHWCGWVLKSQNCCVYVSGDTGYSNFKGQGIGTCQDFKKIKNDYGPIDLAVISVGACYPEWFMCTQHITPKQAVEIHKDVGTKRSVAVHWGTFDLSDEFPHQAVPLELAAACAGASIPNDDFFILKIGETRPI